MKVLIGAFILLLCFLQGYTQVVSYHSLDIINPIEFGGDYIVYQNQKINLGSQAFFIDGQLTDDEVAVYPFVFNSIIDALNSITDGSETDPMILFIAPYVYWVDNPDDTDIRKGKDGRTPYGLEVKCDWLRFYGLTNEPQNVVLACNRGQTIGAIGNFTMFRFDGEGTSSENITFGNYCNVDLEYPLKPELNRTKRASAIVQAQLIHCNGDKVVARNTHFISRLNLCPFVGAKRILFDNCHFESTDDALCGTGVYLNSTLDFYSSKPFYRTNGTGAIFLNCYIHSMAGKNQYFTKANGQLALIDTKLDADENTYFAWNDVTPVETRNFQSNVSVNGIDYLIGSENENSTVDITKLGLLNAYKILYNDSIIYNTYNLLKGDDGWDPMGISALVNEAEKLHAKNYSNLPVQMKISPTRKHIETGKDTLVLNAEVYRFANYKYHESDISWQVDAEFESFVKIQAFENGAKCRVIPKNTQNESKEIVIVAKTKLGLEAASVVVVIPQKIPSPDFTLFPKISKTTKGTLKVNYQLKMDFEDHSFISWYRCSDVLGNNAIKVAVSRRNIPLTAYKLSKGDIGYYIMAGVSPKHVRCDAGEPKYSVYSKPISQNDVASVNHLYTNFQNISVENQLEIIPGFWTFRPLETIRHGKIVPVDSTKDAWYFGEGQQGNANMTGLLQTSRSSTMLYTPVGDRFGDMSIKLEVSPYKTAGQGFSIAPLYMDVLIKFDTKNLNGYGLRFQRTTKYGNAVDCYFVKYDKGKVLPISNSFSTSCYRTPCTIEITVKGKKINAKASTKGDYFNPKFPEILPAIDISTDIITNNFGGFGIQYNGGANTMINEVDINWNSEL